MSFTVTWPGGAADAKFEAYARLLRNKGADLGKLPRVPEPGTSRRWLSVWDTRAEAEAFAAELKRRTGDKLWEVVEVTSPPSEGPLGPIVIQLARRGSGLTFGLHPLSLALVQSAYPEVVPMTDVFIDTKRWEEFQKTRGDVAVLIRQIAPGLTGLSLEQLEQVGYAVVDDEFFQTVLYVPPVIPALGRSRAS